MRCKKNLLTCKRNGDSDSDTMDVIDHKFCEMLLLYTIVHKQSWENIVSKTVNTKLHEVQVEMNQIQKH